MERQGHPGWHYRQGSFSVLAASGFLHLAYTLAIPSANCAGQTGGKVVGEGLRDYYDGCREKNAELRGLPWPPPEETCDLNAVVGELVEDIVETAVEWEAARQVEEVSPEETVNTAHGVDEDNICGFSPTSEKESGTQVCRRRDPPLESDLLIGERLLRL